MKEADRTLAEPEELHLDHGKDCSYWIEPRLGARNSNQMGH